ncbi:MAG: 2,4-dihydroxyhept-2-ene-1,7-dioic acid aldolase, partial [Aestuariibacter sp.]|nr:2,4-dihydroxyhept-2-ene-1,7-dioic acid aldolase [Aestuariibacter sp.]
MLGIVFTTLVDMLEEKISPEFADEVLVEADFENEGVLTVVCYCPLADLEKVLPVLVNAACQSSD